MSTTTSAQRTTIAKALNAGMRAAMEAVMA